VISQRGLLERSVVVLTADHGDMDTHHRLIFKGPAPYEQLQRVPLAIRVPQRFGGTAPRVDTGSLISNADLFPTLLDFAGADVPPCDGLSLRGALSGADRRHARTEAVVQYPSPAIRTLRRDRCKYSLYETGAEMLFDLDSDPDELRNLAGNAEWQREKNDLRETLLSWCEEEGDSFRGAMDAAVG
jgi:arylsulfatase A-like enzyme